MATEIEKKFLVDTKKLPTLGDGKAIKQGYFPTSGSSVVRVRISDNDAFLTIKGENQGMSRLEFEYAIPLSDAEEMFNKLCQSGKIDKTRYHITVGTHVWELDIFHGDNDGLVVAEVELGDEMESFELPDWVTDDVTGEAKYYNSRLISHPFKQW